MIARLQNTFLYPSWKKIGIAAALFILAGWIVWPAVTTSLVTDWYPVGFPLPIRAEGLCRPSGVCIEFSWLGLVIDIAFWYGLSALYVHKRWPVWLLLLGFLGVIVACVAASLFLLF